MLTLTEQGLYFFLGRSDKPAALPFQKWLAGEVLPSIRKTGGYQAKTAQGFPDAAKSLFSFINGIRYPPPVECRNSRLSPSPASTR